MELDPLLPPPKPGPKIEFVTPRNTQPISYVAISKRIWAHHVHWLGARTQPCTLVVGADGTPRVKCDHCAAQMPTRWKGYLHVWKSGELKTLFLCLTPGAGWELTNALGSDYDLRGLTLDVWRSGKAATSLLIVRQNTNFERREVQVAELDPGPFLETIFRKSKPLSQAH
jgi:hypothetical protein